MTLKQRMGLGAALAALLSLAMLGAVFVALSSLARMERAERAVLDVRLLEQKLARTLNEVLLSNGSTASRGQAKDLIPALQAGLHRLGQEAAVPELKTMVVDGALPLWVKVKPLIETLLARRTISTEEVADQIALGKVIVLSDKLSAELEAAVVKTDRYLSEQRQRIHVLAAAGGALGVLFTILLMLYIYRSVLASLGGSPESMAGAVGAFACGDLATAVPVRRGDHSSSMAGLDRMRNSIGASVRAIRQASNSLGTAAKEISQSHADLSTRTEEQASSLEETAASMEQMTATVAQSARNARKASDLASVASDTAERGGKAVSAVVATMTGISESSKKIADITGVIDSIAFQTNILALNAAVEAARAGEQGRGFAVVAAEVRSLAQRSAAAAKEIKDLIAGSAARVDAGSREVNDAGRTMDEIVAAVKKVTGLIAEISAASQEQSQSLSQVSGTVQQLEKVTQQNAAMVEQATAAAGSLEEQAEALVRAVSVFTLDEQVEAGTPNAGTPVLPVSSRASPPRDRSLARSLSSLKTA